MADAEGIDAVRPASGRRGRCRPVSPDAGARRGAVPALDPGAGAPFIGFAGEACGAFSATDTGACLAAYGVHPDAARCRHGLDVLTVRATRAEPLARPPPAAPSEGG